MMDYFIQAILILLKSVLKSERIIQVPVYSNHKPILSTKYPFPERK